MLVRKEVVWAPRNPSGVCEVVDDFALQVMTMIGPTSTEMVPVTESSTAYSRQSITMGTTWRLLQRETAREGDGCADSGVRIERDADSEARGQLVIPAFACCNLNHTNEAGDLRRWAAMRAGGKVKGRSCTDAGQIGKLHDANPGIGECMRACGTRPEVKELDLVRGGASETACACGYSAADLVLRGNG